MIILNMNGSAPLVHEVKTPYTTFCPIIISSLVERLHCFIRPQRRLLLKKARRSVLFSWSRIRESNPPNLLGKQRFYR